MSSHGLGRDRLLSGTRTHPATDLPKREPALAMHQHRTSKRTCYTSPRRLGWRVFHKTCEEASHLNNSSQAHRGMEERLARRGCLRQTPECRLRFLLGRDLFLVALAEQDYGSPWQSHSSPTQELAPKDLAVDVGHIIFALDVVCAAASKCGAKASLAPLGFSDP